MPDKLTDSEIVKDLEDTLHRIKGAKQLIVPKEGVENLCNGLENTLDLINRLQAENKRLKAENEGKDFYLDVEKESHKMSIGVIEHYAKSIKAEAYKECIEKANEIIDLIVDLMFDGNVSKCQLPSCHKPSSIPCESEICIQENKEYWHSKLDNFLKELVGEDK